MGCPVCKNHLDDENRICTGGFTNIDCEICGHFQISGTAEAYFLPESLTSTQQEWLIHKICMNSSPKKRLQVTSYWVEETLKNYKLPDPIEQSEILLLYIGDNLSLEKRGDWIPFKCHAKKLSALICARTENYYQDLNYIFSLLYEQDYMQLIAYMQNAVPIDIRNFRLTFNIFTN